MLLSLLLEADRARDIIHRIALASGAKGIDGEISLARRCEQSFLKKRFPAHRLRHAHSEIAGEESMLRERRNGGWPFTKQSLNSVTQGPLWLPPRRSAAGIGRAFAPLGPMEAVAREAARRGKWLPSRPRKMAADGADSAQVVLLGLPLSQPASPPQTREQHGDCGEIGRERPTWTTSDSCCEVVGSRTARALKARAKLDSWLEACLLGPLLALAMARLDESQPLTSMTSALQRLL